MEIQNLGNFIANNYLIPLPSSSGYMLVDTGYDNGVQRFQREICKRNIEIKEIKFVFLTHAHDDHAGFLNQLLSLNPNANVILHQNAIAGLRRGQNSFDGGCSSALAYGFCKAMALFGKGRHRFPAVEERFRQNFIIYGSEEAKKLEQTLSMRFLETPGHTNCSISLLDHGNLFCGDAAMNGWPSRKRITIWIENCQDFYRSWEKMIALKPKMIYPGHGKPFFYSDLQRNLPCVKQIKLRSLRKKQPSVSTCS